MFNKSFANMRRDLSSGQGIGVSIFSGNSVTKNDVQHIRDFDTAMKNGSTTAQAWRKHMTGCTVAAKQQAKQCLINKGSLTELANGLQQTTVKAKGAELGLKALSIAGNMLMMMGISMAISGIIKGFQALANAQENAIEKANEFISKFEEQRDALTANKQTIDSISSDYEKLAKGVDSLGRNVSLNSDEYARYNEIVNQIADMFPHMVQGYTDEGNAIIKCKGDVEKLTQAYKDQKDAAQDDIIVGSAEVFAGFKASTDKNPKNIWEESGLLQMKELVDKIVATSGDVERIQEVIHGLGGNSLVIGDVFDKIGLDKGWFDWNTLDAEYISENIKKFQSLFNTLNTEIDAQAAKIKPIMQAYLEQSYEYQGLDEDVQDIVKQIIGQFDSEFFAQFDNETEMASWVTDNIINKFKGKDGKDLASKFSIVLDAHTKFNNGEISYDDFDSKVVEFLNLLKDKDIPAEVRTKFMLLFDNEELFNDDGSSYFQHEADKLRERFGEEIYDKARDLNKEEIDAALTIDPSTISSWEDLRKEIDSIISKNKEANKMTVSIGDLEKASDGIKTLGSAFKELSDDGHITTKTLGEIKTATGLADDEWAGYESNLLNAKKGSAEFSQAMSDLTYKILEHEMGAEKLANATEEQIAAILRENGVLNANAVAESIVIAEKNKKLSQSTELAQAYLYEKIGIEELTKKTEEEIEALLTEANIESTVEQRTYLLAQAKDALRFKNALAKATTAEEVVALAMEASQAGITGKALNDLIIDVGIFNNTNLDVSQKVAALQEMGYYAHWTAQGLANIAQVKKYSFGGKTHIISYDKDGKLLGVEKEKEIDIPKVEVPKITIPNYSGAASSGGGKKGSGSDNKPDYEDPTDAIINRINLRSKEIEKQEEEIQNLIKIAELEKDYEKQISLANDLISTRKKRVEELNTANAALNNEVEYLRNSNSWDEDSWFDSQGNATEAYYALFNASSKEQQNQIKDLFEKLSKYKKAYQDNAKEIVELNKEILQDERETIPQLWENLMDDSVSDIEHRIELRNNLVSPDHESNIADYEEIKRLAHLRADAWREAGYGEDSEEVQKWQKTWWDAENSILDESRKIFDERLQLSEDYIQHSKDFGWENGDNEIKARKRVLDWIQSDYYKSLIKDDKEYYKILEEHRLNYLEAQKEEFDKANNFGSSVLDSRKTLLQSYFDVTNSIVEAQHEINKELEASKTMYEWLDEDTRKLLFNQEDYNALSEELYDIQYKADKLKRQYERDLNNSTLETVESITSNYQMQYETLMKSYEIAKADLEIAKKKQKLNNVLNERNVRMFINGQWQWVANTEDVANAKSELADAEYAKRVEEAGLTQQESINNLTKRQDELSVVIKQFENGIIDLDEAIKLAKNAIGSLPSALSSMYSNASQNNVSSGSSYSSGRILQVGNDGKAPAGATVGDTIVTAGGNYKIVPAGTSGAKYNPASGHYSIKVGAVSSGSSGGSGSGSSRNPISSNKSGINISTVYIKQKKAKGTGYTQSGSMLAGEDGEEIFVDNNGHLIPVLQPTIFKDIEAGGKVFNTDQMKSLRTLWDMSNLNFGNSSFMSNMQPQQVSHTQDNRIIINGLTVDNGSTDGQALISALRRYVGNH